ncbi:hypothetical protein CLV35_1170 [Motilibacter peucedani]|uniref:Uncharacterized protein n=1 Tax=Motilibacter peucedani TaxID=598650 RepID=A0A420XRJ4_9ACTN|nr:hypothetical protein [Motilibacter peucedani]RKS77484.1 hypothetical protein CLV35_1170 [Motilibacter peucedani]
MPQMRFGPDDEKAFYAACDDIVDAFEQTPAGDEFSWVARTILELKFTYLGGDLTTWSVDDVEQILLDIYPRKVSIEPGDERDILDGFAALLQYLEAIGIVGSLDPRLVPGIQRSLHEFTAAMADRSRWGMAKSLMAEADDEGVDVQDSAALQAFIDNINARSWEERGRIFGLDRTAPEPPLWGGGPMPGAAVPSEAELRASAAGNVWLRRLRTFVDWVGAGKALTDTGNLRRADGEALVALLATSDRITEKQGSFTYRFQSSRELAEVDLTFALAAALGLVEVRARKLLPASPAAPLDDPLAAWRMLVTAYLDEIGPAAHRWRLHDDDLRGSHAAQVDAAVPAMLATIYLEHGTAPLTTVVEHLGPVSKPFDVTLYEALLALRRLGEMGVLVIEPEFDDLDLESYWLKPIATGLATTTATLTGLGTWFLQDRARRQGFGVAGSLIGHPAAELLRAAADLPDDESLAELDAWVGAHDNAAALLVEAVRDAGEAERSLAFRALLRIGTPAAPAVASLLDDPRLRPHALVWRVDAGLAAESEVRVDDADGLMRMLSAVLELWGPQSLPHWASLVAAPAGSVRLLESAWRSTHPATGDVLAALAEHAGDKVVAKAARTAHFKLRSRS